MKDLSKVLKLIESRNFVSQFKNDYSSAMLLLTSLQRLDALQEAITQMDQKKMLEIKSYSNPPVLVQDVISATLLLLGETDKDVKVRKS